MATAAENERKTKRGRRTKIFMPFFQRRSDIFPDEAEKEFNDRMINVFAEKRHEKSEEFKKECEDFLKLLKMEFIWGETGQSKFVTITRLMKILQKSAKSIRDLLPHKIVSTLMKITNFNMTIDMKLIEELINTAQTAEQIYLAILPFAENSFEISNDGLQEFISSQMVPKMIEAPERADYYAAYAVGIIFFVLDARRREFLFIKDLLSSTLLMRMEECIEAENNCYELPEVDIFSVAQFRATLQEFRYLDTDRNGVLSPKEMELFRDGYFNQIFIQRIFDISLTYEKGCLDFKGFVDLICAIHFRHTKASARYHFEALDLKNDGVLDEEEIRTATSFQAQVLPEYAPDDGNTRPEDVIARMTAELMDMLRMKKEGGGISLEEFASNRMSPTFTGVLSNYSDFSKYEGREQ